jgi:hypothetical protein
VVPAGFRRVCSQREALRAGPACPDLADVRADHRENLIKFWRIHVLHASWGGENRPPRGTTRPTRARACELAGFGESTYKACRRWWEARGYLAIVRRGRTPALRPMVLADPDDRNEAQVYVLCVPRRKPPGCLPTAGETISRPLSGFRRKPDNAPNTQEAKPKVKPEEDRAPRGLPVLPRPGPAPLGAVPQNRSEALGAAQAMQERARLLRELSAEHLRHLARPFWLAGWQPRDVLHALDFEPGGRQHGYTAEVRFPAAWIRSRLAQWTDPETGTACWQAVVPLPSPSQLRAAERDRIRAEAAARRDQAAELAAARTADSDGWGARARAMLAARGGRVAQDLARWQLRRGPA